MNKILEKLRLKAKDKSFYQLNPTDRVKVFSECVFNYDDSNIPYKTRKAVLKDVTPINWEVLQYDPAWDVYYDDFEDAEAEDIYKYIKNNKI